MLKNYTIVRINQYLGNVAEMNSRVKIDGFRE